MWYKLPQEMWEIHAQFMWCQSKDVGGGSEWGQEGAICQSTKTRHNYGKYWPSCQNPEGRFYKSYIVDLLKYLSIWFVRIMLVFFC